MLRQLLAVLPKPQIVPNLANSGSIRFSPGNTKSVSGLGRLRETCGDFNRCSRDLRPDSTGIGVNWADFGPESRSIVDDMLGLPLTSAKCCQECAELGSMSIEFESLSIKLGVTPTDADPK